MNLQRIRPNEKKTTPTGKMLYDSTHIFEIRKKMKNRLVVARVKDGGEVSGELSVAIKGQHRDPCGDGAVLHLDW